MTDSSEKHPHLLDYWTVLVKRRWVVFTILPLVVAIVGLGTFLQDPIYKATARVQIERSLPKVLPFQEVVSTLADIYSTDFYGTQYEIIRSRRVAGEVIDSLNLASHREFQVGRPETPRPGLTIEQMVEAARISSFLGRLDVQPVEKSRLVDISYSLRDPVMAARIANRVAETYIAFNSEVQYNTTNRATASLAHQIANLQEKIDAREKELQAYAREHGIVALSEKQNIALKNLNDLNDAYTRARADRIEKEARYAALRESGPEDIPEVQRSPLIKELLAKSAELERRRAQLSERYKPEWPEMVRLDREIEANGIRLETEREALYEQVLGAAESAYRASRNEEKQLGKSLENQKRQSQDFSLKEIQYNNLKAEIANQRETLDALLRRQAETSSSADLNLQAESNVRIVDPAEVPTRASSPRTTLNIMVSVILGVCLSIGMAFFLEYMDKSVKNQEEVFQATGVPSIGVIPTLRSRKSGLRVIVANEPNPPHAPSIELICHQDPKSKISEAFRDVRTSLLVSQPGGPPRTILIVSTQPGEGKTTVAANLAITLAQIGRRVLLVDADLRRARLHQIFKVPGDQGLSNYLSGTGPPWLEPCVTSVPGLALVPSGPLPPNPADLLDSDRFVQVQAEFAEQGYQHVIYDSPPVLAVADPAIMAGRVDAVLLVVQVGVTSREALAHSANRLQQVKSRIVGAVLTRVDAERQGYYYGYTYESPATDEGSSALPRAAGRSRVRRSKIEA